MNGPLTRDNCQPQGYGPMNCGNTHGVGGNPLVRESCPPHGYMPPDFGGDQSGISVHTVFVLTVGIHSTVGLKF